MTTVLFIDLYTLSRIFYCLLFKTHSILARVEMTTERIITCLCRPHEQCSALALQCLSAHCYWFYGPQLFTVWVYLTALIISIVFRHSKQLVEQVETKNES